MNAVFMVVGGYVVPGIAAAAVAAGAALALSWLEGATSR